LYPGLKETPSQEDWLISILPENSKVGVDPWIIAAGRFAVTSFPPSGHGKPGKVMEFINGYFQAWKSPGGENIQKSHKY